jgi:hypothetical protein
MNIEVNEVSWGDSLGVQLESPGFCILSASHEVLESGIHYITIELIPERKADAREEPKAPDDSVPS